VDRARQPYQAPSVFEPANLLREARRQKGLAEAAVPEICLLDPDGDIVRRELSAGLGFSKTDRDLNIRRESYSAPWLTDIVWDAAARLGYGRHFLRDPMPVEDDHVPFLKLGVPATLLIDFDFPPWHTADDTLDKVSAESLTIVGNVVLEALPSVEHYLSREGGRR